jgi:hypothetical protein
VKRRSHRIRTPSRHTAKHGVLALTSAEAARKGAKLLGREYEIRHWSGNTPEVNYLNGLVGFYVTGIRSDGRTRTVFIRYGEGGR